MNASSDQYNLNTINHFNDINDCNDSIVTFFWHNNPLLLSKLIEYYNKYYKNNNNLCLEIGPGFCPLSISTHFIDWDFDLKLSNKNNIFKLDLDYDSLPFDNNYFNFLYCRHVFEDIQNPLFLFNEITKKSPNGYIETPSPFAEVSNVENINYLGYIHHRYIVWSCLETNTLYFLPKYPIIEYLFKKENTYNFFLEKTNYLLNNYPIYWNNYYMWDENNKPNIVVYRNGINMIIKTDYINLINLSFIKTISYTNHFLKKINNII
jgi:hypothetical protein